MIIRCWDFECTGLSPDDSAVIEAGWCDIAMPERTIGNPSSALFSTTYPITPENRAIHHINPATLVGKPPFDPDAFNEQCVEDGVTCLAAHNAAYDASFLRPTLPVICTYKSALRAWPNAPSHGLSVLRYWLEAAGRLNGFNYAHAATHRAGPDAYVCAWILRCLLEDGHTGREMVQWSKEPAMLPRCPVGKHRGKEWAEVDTAWLRWCIGSDLGEDVRLAAKREIDSRVVK